MSDARQEHIIRLVRTILPEHPPPRIHRIQVLIGLLLFLCALAGGYVIRDLMRPLNYYEFITLRSMMEVSARHSSISMEEMTRRVRKRFHICNLQDIRAYEWTEVLRYLSRGSN